MSRLPILGLAAASLLAAGCQSRFLDAKLVNDTDAPLHTVELDYPGGSFGTTTLQPHGSYPYHLKTLGTGVLQLSFVDQSGASHQLNGPEVGAAVSGELTVRVEPGSHVQWVLRRR